MGKFDKYKEFEVEDNRIMTYYGNGGDVVIPEGITDIFFDVFEYNYQITSVVIPGTITDIAPFAFEHCTSLEKVLLHEGVLLLGFFSFQNCPELEGVFLPKSLTHIDKGVFKDCNQLTIYYAGSKEEWEKIEIEADLSNVPVIFNSTI